MNDWKALRKGTNLDANTKMALLLLFDEVQGIEARSAPRPQMDSETNC